ncbi:uncharacterized protein ACNLHF_019589 [Anomaloglossus baeobatrachus]
MMMLPSPLFKKERLMLTNPMAQRRYNVRQEENTGPSNIFQTREKRKREEKEKTMRDLCKDLDEEVQGKKPSVKKLKLDRLNLQIPERRTTRESQIPERRTTPERRIQQDNNHQYVNRFLGGRRNLIWTMLLGPLE